MISLRGVQECCKPVIDGVRVAETAEELMRSRFSAYCMKNVSWIVETTHPENEQLLRSASRDDQASSGNGSTVAGSPDEGSADEGSFSFRVRLWPRRL